MLVSICLQNVPAYSEVFSTDITISTLHQFLKIHRVSRCLFSISQCLMAKEVYDQTAFILHATSRRQTFVHCARFPVAATRRCTGRVSVLFWGVILSNPLPVIVLVGHYPTNKLMGNRLIHRRTVKSFSLARSCGISSSFDKVFHTIG